MKDFTLKTYQNLLHSLQQQGFSFQTFQEYIESKTNLPKGELDSPLGDSRKLSGGASEDQSKTIILRHDVDKLPKNSLRFAQIQHKLGIKGSYYFRMVPESFNVEIITEIISLGHEVGLHYETMDLAAQSIKYQVSSIKTSEEKERIIVEKAIELFENHLTELRKYYPVKTICMHGSPLSKYDNKLIWKYYNYRDYGIIGEPYFDVDFSKVLYLTDTGRRWNGEKVSIRDKVSSHNSQFTVHNSPDTLFHSTNDIIKATTSKQLPNQIMFTFHPQRWTNKTLPWVKELVLQNVKNIVKYYLITKTSKTK